MGTRSRIATYLAVAASIVAVALAADVVRLNGRLDDKSDTPYEAALKADGSRIADVISASSKQPIAQVVVLPDGTGYMKNDGMAGLDADQTYQLWALVGHGTDRRVISAGVLGDDPGVAPFHVGDDVEGFAVTIEKAGGVERSHNAPVATATLA
jgi:hypothetical protein